MKKEEAKANNSAILMAGIAASIVMVVIVLAFLKGPVTGNAITPGSTNLKEKVQLSPEYYTKQEIDSRIKENYQKSMGNKPVFNETFIIKELSGKGDAYLCINSEGKLFRSEVVCK
jgi:hypothetical protein